jgi:diacylglycerol kinase (ATP)
MALIFKKPLLIYNPAAGGGKAKKKFEIYYKKLIEEKIFEKIDVCETKSKQEAFEKVLEAHKDNKYDLLISIGGDGTISTVANALMNIPFEKRLPLYPLPSGSGDSLLRDFDIYSIEDSIKSYRNCDSLKLFDLFLLEVKESNFKWYCINVLGMGFISDIATSAVKHGKKYGAFSYVIALFLCLKEFKPYKTKILYNDKKDAFECDKLFFFTVSNTKYSGGGIKVAPDASYNDGLMDVVILHNINRFQFLKGFFKAMKGKHLKEKGCFSFRTNTLEITSTPDFILMPDGDIEGKSPVKVTLIPKQIKLVV